MTDAMVDVLVSGAVVANRNDPSFFLPHRIAHG